MYEVRLRVSRSAIRGDQAGGDLRAPRRAFAGGPAADQSTLRNDSSRVCGRHRTGYRDPGSLGERIDEPYQGVRPLHPAPGQPGGDAAAQGACATFEISDREDRRWRQAVEGPESYDEPAPTTERVSSASGCLSGMYIATFYSFKGGVGRSMALANVAVELAKRGRRVLAVDFDLEAPGLDTFDILRPEGDVPGIIDFVHDYLGSDRAPDVREFTSRLSDVGDRDGELWIMPSGAQRTTYAAQFNEIDWAELYEKRDGYLLFEDLKAQWESCINPDYVLIDSRTGHTDTGGICTRQLPDAVAILFFPNEQNLRGLTKVVGDIRAEAGEPRKKEIDLHFVMSNVPDLDDEDRILQTKIDAFRKQLGFVGEPMIVHRYDSLSLLNQVVFTSDRPRSRLAREYRHLVREIVGRNMADRDGALDYIERAGERWRRRGTARESPEKISRKLRQIESTHAIDGDVLFALGTFFEGDGQQDRAASFFDRAIDAGCEEPEAYLKRARVRTDEDPASATEDVLRALETEGLPPPLVREAARLVSEEKAGAVAGSRAVTSLDADGRVWLANVLNWSLKEVRIGASVLEPLVNDEETPPRERAEAMDSLAICYLGLGKCEAARKLLDREGRGIDRMDIVDAFNYGMAVWGDAGDVDVRPFARVVELHASDPKYESANYCQCMAVANWAVGDDTMSVDCVERARNLLETKKGREFSCWRYQRVPVEEFLMDLDEVEAFMQGDASRKPRFMTARADS